MTKQGFNKLTSSLEVHVYAASGAQRYNVTYRIKHPQAVELSQYLGRDNAFALSELVEGSVKQASDKKAEMSNGCSYSREGGISFGTTWVRYEYTSRKDVINSARSVGRVVQMALEHKLRQMQAAYPEIEFRVVFEPGA